MSLSSDSLVLQHQKDVCYCIYHQAFCLYQLFFSSLWGICFVVLDWLVLLFSDCFLEIKFYGKHLMWTRDIKPAEASFHHYSAVAY